MILLFATCGAHVAIAWIFIVPFYKLSTLILSMTDSSGAGMLFIANWVIAGILLFSHATYSTLEERVQFRKAWSEGWNDERTLEEFYNDTIKEAERQKEEEARRELKD